MDDAGAHVVLRVRVNVLKQLHGRKGFFIYWEQGFFVYWEQGFFIYWEQGFFIYWKQGFFSYWEQAQEFAVQHPCAMSTIFLDFVRCLAKLS